MNIILSINPKYVSKILKGEKKIEFRRTLFKKNVKKVFIYSTSPEKKIVAEFEIKNITFDKPKNLWDKFQFISGVNEMAFYSYFEGKQTGYAIEITNLLEYDDAIDPKEKFSEFQPPQSFKYTSWTTSDLINKDGVDIDYEQKRN